MNTTSLHVKIEPKIKRDAQKAAEELGLSLSAVTKVLLKQFARTKRLSVGVMERPEIPNEYLKQSLTQSAEDIKAGRVKSFASPKEALAYLDQLTADETHSPTH